MEGGSIFSKVDSFLGTQEKNIPFRQVWITWWLGADLQTELQPGKVRFVQRKSQGRLGRGHPGPPQGQGSYMQGRRLYALPGRVSLEAYSEEGPGSSCASPEGRGWVSLFLYSSHRHFWSICSMPKTGMELNTQTYLREK